MTSITRETLLAAGFTEISVETKPEYWENPRVAEYRLLISGDIEDYRATTVTVEHDLERHRLYAYLRFQMFHVPLSRTLQVEDLVELRRILSHER